MQEIYELKINDEITHKKNKNKKTVIRLIVFSIIYCTCIFLLAFFAIRDSWSLFAFLTAFLTCGYFTYVLFEVKENILSNQGFIKTISALKVTNLQTVKATIISNPRPLTLDQIRTNAVAVKILATNKEQYLYFINLPETLVEVGATYEMKINKNYIIKMRKTDENE